MKYLFLALFGLLLFGCGTKTENADIEQATEMELPEDFKAFYQRFHSDSLYQMEHIVFPLEGLPDKADGATIAADTFRWTPENWRFQRAVDFEVSDFTRHIIPINDVMVREYIVHKTGEFGMERRFAKMGNEWYLIYYAGLNRFAKPDSTSQE
ncbi:MAG: hypothetical protein KatS3mg029_0979 [Saprospiraceae bacterium]|nr:MAG: hypothetical protein KatS3mg029_0979 [Saprospiraceae bacterium]